MKKKTCFGKNENMFLEKWKNILKKNTFGKQIKNKSKARLIRDGAVIYTGEIVSIFREKDQVKEVTTGQECGIGLKDFIDFKEKDIIESYTVEKIERQI
mgnify:CR=1 FL=1